LAVRPEGSIAEEAEHSGDSSLSGGRLEGGEGGSLREEGGVTGTGIIEEGANDLT
jgi:hypothetical protein